ncbi:MAG TPA: HAMP domain-containing sensor histidine kinase [Ktedonobacterales bacterium]
MRHSQLDHALAPSDELLPLDLARLAIRAGDPSSGGLRSIAPTLLDCLANACRAEGGALVIITDRDAGMDHDHTEDNEILPDATVAGVAGARTGVAGARILALRQLSADGSRLVVADAQATAPTPETAPDDAPNGAVQRLVFALDHDRARIGPAADDPCVALILRWPDDEVGRARAREGARLLATWSDAIHAVILAGARAEETAGRARETDRLKAEIIGTVSHELRGPLATVKGYADTLARHERRLPASERREFLRAIGHASGRLDHLITQMLELARLDAGAVHFERLPLDAEDLARDALRAAARSAADRTPGRFTFRLRVEPRHAGRDGDRLVLGDPGRLREVLDQLIENAIRYSPDGGIVTVEVRGDLSHGPDRPGVLLVVRDTGQGIPEEHLGRVFERFFRVDTSFTREVGGLGLGLAICAGIVAMHGGSIWAESAPDGGSAFYVRLPSAVIQDPAWPQDSVAPTVMSRER